MNTPLIPIPLVKDDAGEGVSIDAGDFGLYSMEIIEDTARKISDPMQRVWMIVLLRHVADLLSSGEVSIVRLGVLSREEACSRAAELKDLSRRMEGWPQ